MTSPLPLRPLLKFKPVAEILGQSLPMVYKLVRSGDLPVVRIGASVRIHQDDLERFIAERRGRRAG
jgi:excisionase family DNA binding protein